MTKTNIKRLMFFNVLEDVFLGKVRNIEGLSATVKLMKIKNRYYQSVIKPTLEKEICEVIQKYPDFEEELYDKLYTFFSRYFTEGGAIAFAKTPFHNNVYDRIYTNEKDVILFWKTRDLYYIKTEKVFRSMEFDYKDYHLVFDASRVEGKRSNEKRSVIFTLKKIEGKTITFEVHYKEGGREIPLKDILREFKSHRIDLTEEDLNEIFKTYNRQTEIDFFIHKRPREFLKEQFNLWLYQYLSTDHEWPLERLNQFNLLRKVALTLIDMIAQFEEEILKIWLKPRFVLNSNYVISLDRIVKKGGWHIIEKLQKHPGWQEQVREWIELGVLKKAPDSLIEENLLEKNLKKEYQFLPIDTKYFKDLETEILSLFDNLDEELDGWLIKSENFQALNTILPKFKGKVQTIYIDPPFNKEQEADYYYIVKYKDSTWATMLENRLRLAKEFLKDSGAIFVRCDYNGNWLVRCIMDDIFGKENFRNEIIINRTRAKQESERRLIQKTESVFFYAKDKNHLNLNMVERPRSPEWYPLLHFPREDNTPRIFLGKVFYPPKGRRWALSQERIDSFIKKGKARINYNLSYIDCHGNYVQGVPELLYDFEIVGNEWLDIPGYGQKWHFPTENSEYLLERIISLTSDERDIVMDFFLGSGTTCAVAHKLRRRWIGIEMGDYFNSIILNRMKKVIFYDSSYISELPHVKEKYNKNNAGGFFKYYELESFEEIFSKIKYTNFVNSHLFLCDKKLSECFTVVPEEDKIKTDLSKLYNNIDIAESISNLLGSKIKKIDRNAIYFENGIIIEIDDIPYEVIKELVLL